MTIATEVKKELQALKECGARVSKRALDYPEANQEEMEELRASGMRIGDIADFILQIA